MRKRYRMHRLTPNRFPRMSFRYMVLTSRYMGTYQYNTRQGLYRMWHSVRDTRKVDVPDRYCKGLCGASVRAKQSRVIEGQARKLADRPTI